MGLLKQKKNFETHMFKLSNGVQYKLKSTE